MTIELFYKIVGEENGMLKVEFRRLLNRKVTKFLRSGQW